MHGLGLCGQHRGRGSHASASAALSGLNAGVPIRATRRPASKADPDDPLPGRSGGHPSGSGYAAKRGPQGPALASGRAATAAPGSPSAAGTPRPARARSPPSLDRSGSPWRPAALHSSPRPSRRTGGGFRAGHRVPPVATLPVGLSPPFRRVRLPRCRSTTSICLSPRSEAEKIKCAWGRRGLHLGDGD